MSEPPLLPPANRTVYPVLDALRTCIVTQLVHVQAPVCFFPVIYADHPLPAQRCDCTCEGGGHGEAWVRMVKVDRATAVRTRTRPSAPGMVDNDCGDRRWVFTVEVGVWRCAPTLDDNGNPPDDADYDTHTQAMLNDAVALERAWRCCDFIENLPLITAHQLDTIAPSGPAGGCVGTIATGRLIVDECTPCP